MNKWNKLGKTVRSKVLTLISRVCALVFSSDVYLIKAPFSLGMGHVEYECSSTYGGMMSQ